MEGQVKWKWADVGKFLRNSFHAVIRGEFLLRVRTGRYFVHIIYTFFLFFASIWLSLVIEKTLTKVEENKKVLTDLEIYHTHKTVELAALDRMTTVRKMLGDMGSDVGMPEKPAETIKKH